MATPVSDVFSLGRTLCSLLTGSLTQPASAPPLLPTELAQIVRKATNSDPSDQYPTARAFARALEDYLARLPNDQV